MRTRYFAGLALLTLPYLGYVATTWRRYGRPIASRRGEASPLDPFLPDPEVSERHEVEVAAPASVTFVAARELDIQRSALVRAIFAVRTLPSLLAGAPPRAPVSLVSETQALGWRILAETPGRSIVLGAVTQPWLAEVEFRGLDPDAFAAFAEPGYARIAWSLETVPLGDTTSRFRTETRVATTDARSRSRFRAYWSVVAPGIRLIRHASLGLVKAEAERRWRGGRVVPFTRLSGSVNPAGASVGTGSRTNP
jgi:hypothetical protein